MRANILDIIRTQCKLRTTLYGFRVYVEGTQLTAKELNKIYEPPPRTTESITSWAQKTIGAKKFGIIINRGENLNNELAKRMAHKISPLLKKAGTLLLGINFTFLTDDPSVGLTLWFNNKLKSELAIKLLKVVEDPYLKESTKTMVPDKNDLEDLRASQQAIDLFKLPKDLENLPFRTFMK